MRLISLEIVVIYTLINTLSLQSNFNWRINLFNKLGKNVYECCKDDDCNYVAKYYKQYYEKPNFDIDKLMGIKGIGPKIHDVLITGPYEYIIIMDKVNGMTFKNYSTSQQYTLCHLLQEKMQFMHNLGVSHQDLHSENIMVSDNNNTLILVDFDSSSWLSDNPRILQEQLADDQNMVKKICKNIGTPEK